MERNAREALRGAPARLTESVLYALLGPGKRIRPRLAMAVGDALDLDSEVALSIATAIEMTHAYTLVHDDLPAMDDDDFRRGRPTTHKAFGEGLAILAGDSLALLAPGILLGLRGRLPAERVLALGAELVEAAGARGVIAGQAAEMDLATATTADASGLFAIFRKKTGALFRAALTMPAIAAGAEAGTVAALGGFGDALGIAFQIADDLEDDFAAKKGDPAHVARYLGAGEARAEAERFLVIPASLPTRIRGNLAPLLDEFRGKIRRTGV